MKRFLVFLLFVLGSFAFLGCNKTTTTAIVQTTTDIITTITDALTTDSSTTSATTVVTTDNDPVISGATDKTIEKNSTFVPLEGITASDVEDGDLTDQIQYSGNVNPMAEGEYTATYTVTDSDGNITSVTITVTVVYTDTQPPLMVGTGDIEIYVGEDFDPMDGVSANDTIDGTVAVTYTGEVDVWTEGDYTLTYSAMDNSGNEATVERTVTVSFGDFIFGDPTNYLLADFTDATSVLTSPAFSGGEINTSIADFAYVKVEVDITTDAAGQVTIDLDGLDGSATTLDVTGAADSFVVYYVIDAPLTDATFTIDYGTLSVTALSVDISFAEVRDMVAPTLNVPSDEIAYVVNYSQSGLEDLLMTSVTAVDDVDGNLKDSVTIDYGTLDLTTVGEYDVVYSVSDAAGNESTFTRTVIIGNTVDSGFISDPTFQNEGEYQWNEKSNDGQASITYDDTEGTMNVTVTSLGNWLSAAGAYLKEDSSGLQVDQWYMFTFTVKTTIDRQMGFRMGLVTDQAHGWVDDFDGRDDILLSIDGDYQTFNFFFKLDSLVSSDGSTLFNIELNLGNLNYSNIGTNGVTTFKDVYLYRVVTSYEPPVYVVNEGPELPVKFTEGDSEPVWADYVTFHDMVGNVVVPTIDSSAVDMSTAGTYDVVFTATDDHDMTTVYTLEIEVVTAANADTVGPVITQDSAVVTTIDQFTDLSVPLIDLVTATDAVDGEITILPDMIDDGGFDSDVAGVYTVTYTVYDKSGNTSQLTVDITVNDKEAPTINAGSATINLGDAYDALAGVVINDNVDGVIDNANATVTGLDAFMTDGLATAEGTFDVTIEVSDAAGNTASKTITVVVTDLVWDETTRTDLLGNQDEGPTHSSVAYDDTEEAYLITGIDPNTDSWDHARWVYYFDNTELVKGNTYKFEITVKADTATDLYFRVGSTLYVDPWIDNFEGGVQTVSITTDYVTYQVIFTVDKDMPNGSAKFQFMYGYLQSDATNTIYIKSFDLVMEAQPEYLDVMDLLTPDELHNVTGTVDFTEGAYVLSDFPQADYDWNASRLVYYFNQSTLEQNNTYRIIFTVKSDVATEIHLRIGSTLSADPWIDNFEGGLQTINVDGTYTTFEFVFTVDKAMPDGTAKFQFMFGYLATDDGNVIYVKDFQLQQVIMPRNVDSVTIDDFTYADEAEFEAAWTYRSSGANTSPADDMNLNPDDDSFTFTLPASANEGWILARRYESLANLGVTDDDIYLAFYFTNNTNKTEAGVWLYWSGSQNAYTVTLPAAGESGWVVVNVTDSGHNPTEITDFGIGFNNWSSSQATGSFTISKIVAVKDVTDLDYIIRPALEPVVPMTESIDDFTYADEAAFEAAWTYRSSGVETSPADDMNLDTQFNAMVFDMPATANDGWILAKCYSSLTSLGGVDETTIMGIYLKNDTNATEAAVWLYWSGNQGSYTFTLPAAGETGWVYIDIADSGHTVSEITAFGIGFNNWSSNQVTGSFTVYEIALVEDPLNLLKYEVNIPKISVTLDDFTYADEAAFEDAWTYRSSGANTSPADDMNLNPEKDSFTFTLPATANDGWILARRYESLANLGGLDQTKILAFYMTNNTNVTEAGVWLYWSGNQNVYTVTLPAAGETGWVYVDVTNSGHAVSEITNFGIGFNNWSSSQVTGSFTIFEIVMVEEASQLTDLVVNIPAVDHLVDDFSTYADEAAFEAVWTERTNGTNITPSDIINVDTTAETMVFTLPATAADGWNLARLYQPLTAFGGTDDTKYLCFYVTNNTNVTEFSVWLYWSGSQNPYTVTLPAIGESGWAYIDVNTSGHSTTEITDISFGFNNWSSSQVTGNLVIDTIKLSDTIPA